MLTALGEREALIARTEREAGKALATMTRAEGLSLREAVDWCASALSVREATRLRRLAEIPEVSDATAVSDDPGDDLGDDWGDDQGGEPTDRCPGGRERPGSRSCLPAALMAGTGRRRLPAG